MLGKLIKYEFKETYKMGGLMLLLILAVSLLGVVGFVSPLSMLMEHGEVLEAAEEPIVSVVWVMTMVVSLVLYIIVLIGVMYGILIYSGVHFYRSMYTDEGYLTQTLPVTPHQLLISKTLVAGVWYLTVEIAMIVSILALVFAMVNSVSGAVPDMNAYFGEMSPWEFFNQMFVAMSSELGINAVHYVLSMLLVFLVTPFATILMLFGSVTIGQLSRKYKGMMGIVAYFVVMIINMLLAYIIQFLFMFGTIVIDNGGGSVPLTSAYDSSTVLGLIMGTAMYFISHHILSKRLNME